MAYVSKINGYTIRDTEAHTRLDGIDQQLAKGVGKIDNVQIGGTNLSISNKAVNIETDSTYNATTNKIATVKTVTDKAAEVVAGIVAGADTKYDTLKEIADYIASDTTGAAQMSTNIAQNASDIDDLEAVVDNLSIEENYNSTDQSLELELGSGGVSKRKTFLHKSTIYIINTSLNLETYKIYCEMITQDSGIYTYDNFTNVLSAYSAVNADSPYKPVIGLYRESNQGAVTQVIGIKYTNGTLTADFGFSSIAMYGSGVSGKTITFSDTVYEL